VIDRILRHLGLPTETPAPRPARAPPLLAGVPDAAGWDDDASVFLTDGPHVGAPEVCAEARSHAPNEALGA
jgi:hypothetical protein